MGYEFWILALFSFSLTTSILISIFSITNATSGNTSIQNTITPFTTVFPFMVLIFCVAFGYLLKQLADVPETRKITLYLFVCFTYILALLTLHLSTFIINLRYT